MLSTDWHLPDEDSVEYYFPSTLSSEIRQGIKAAHADMFEYFGHWGHKFFVLSDDSAASTPVLTELCKALPLREYGQTTKIHLIKLSTSEPISFYGITSVPKCNALLSTSLFTSFKVLNY
jgi:hypothetical protein